MLPKKMFILCFMIYLILFTLTSAKRKHRKHRKHRIHKSRTLGFDPGPPIPLNDYEELYKYKRGQEIILSNKALPFIRAISYCFYRFHGDAIMPKTTELAEDLAAILAESDMELDNMWIGLRNETWIDGSALDKNSGIYKFFIKRNPHDIPDKRECYSFTRFNHDDPTFVDMNCHAPRGVICIRSKN